MSATAPARRQYDTPVRTQKAAATRERIVQAGSELVHGFASWDWQELTFRAVAERAGVGERTVYRHFPTERHLHDAVMQRLEEEAGITYEDVTLDNLGDVTAKVFLSRGAFAVDESVTAPDSPTFVAVDQRRRDALRHAVEASTATLDRRRTHDGGRACSTCCGTCRRTNGWSACGTSMPRTPRARSRGSSTTSSAPSSTTNRRRRREAAGATKN